MGTYVQYAVSIVLFVAVPVGIQWAVARLSARRGAMGHAEAQEPLAQTIRD